MYVMSMVSQLVKGRRWKDKRGLEGVLRDFHVNPIQVGPNDAEEPVCEI